MMRDRPNNPHLRRCFGSLGVVSSVLHLLCISCISCPASLHLLSYISPPQPMVLDGCPMFAQAYMGRKGILPMLSLDAQGLLLLALSFRHIANALGGAAPYKC
jgi:hypothetical protein